MDSHIILLYEHGYIKLRGLDVVVQLCDSVDVVNLLLDGGRHEGCKPPTCQPKYLSMKKCDIKVKKHRHIEPWGIRGICP